ncbi:MAG: hypothetical protein E6K54_07890 [Gammaproteobacteria bacterium]|nr:MAG: hypothetical protein E6K54_07890 [Gammaproteobacteria bacterium]
MIISGIGIYYFDVITLSLPTLIKFKRIENEFGKAVQNSAQTENYSLLNQVIIDFLFSSIKLLVINKEVKNFIKITDKIKYFFNIPIKNKTIIKLLIEHVSNMKDCQDKQIKYKITPKDYKKNSNKLLSVGYSLKEAHNIIFKQSSIVATVLQQHNCRF